MELRSSSYGLRPGSHALFERSSYAPLARVVRRKLLPLTTSDYRGEAPDYRARKGAHNYRAPRGT